MKQKERKELAKTILIINNEDSIRQLISYILRSAGYDSVEAFNGKDALRKLNGNDVGMIISDYRMPNMDAVDFLKDLRKDPKYITTPVVMLTPGFLHEQRVREIEEVGATACITKPLIHNQLLYTIKKLKVIE